MTSNVESSMVIKKVKKHNEFIGDFEVEVEVPEEKPKKPGRLSVRLSLSLLSVLILMLGMVAAGILRLTSDTEEELILNEARTTSITAATAFGRALETAIDAKDITLQEVLHPSYQKMVFYDENKQILELEDQRYYSELARVVEKYGLVQLQNEIVRRGHGVLFASAINVDGYVPGPNDHQNNPPRGTKTEENKKWDRDNSRQYRIYNKEGEQRNAAAFKGDQDHPTTVFTYRRDTGQEAWDVVSPITVKGQHFGAFRIGVSRDHIQQLYWALLYSLSVMFGVLTLFAAGFVFLMVGRSIKPLRGLAHQIDELSQTTDMDLLNKPIEPPDNTEIGTVATSVNRLRKSLASAMERLLPSKTNRASTVYNQNFSETRVGSED